MGRLRGGRGKSLAIKNTLEVHEEFEDELGSIRQAAWVMRVMGSSHEKEGCRGLEFSQPVVDRDEARIEAC